MANHTWHQLLLCQDTNKTSFHGGILIRQCDYMEVWCVTHANMCHVYIKLRMKSYAPESLPNLFPASWYMMGLWWIKSATEAVMLPFEHLLKHSCNLCSDVSQFIQHKKLWFRIAPCHITDPNRWHLGVYNTLIKCANKYYAKQVSFITQNLWRITVYNSK